MRVYRPIRFIVPTLMLVSFLTRLEAVSETTRSSGTMDAQLSCGASQQPRYATVKPSILNQAMLGVDPSNLDQIDRWNSGSKDQIFISVSPAAGTHDTFQLSDFIGRAVQDLRCTSLFSPSMITVHNYNSYKDAIREQVSLQSGDETIIGSRSLCSASASELTARSNEETKLVEFFKNGGEIVLGEVQCRTHTVSVNLNTKPLFTQSFLNAVRKVISAAKNPVHEIMRNTVFNFFESFGTHFQVETQYGSRLVMMKTFSRKSANVSEDMARHSCVSSSFTNDLTKDSTIDEIMKRFKWNVPQCEKSVGTTDLLSQLNLPSHRIFSAGAFPLFDRSETHLPPIPIYRKLKKLSTLFQEDWFGCLHPSENTATAYEFLEKMLVEYYNASRNSPCATAKKVGCGYNSNCSLREKCFDNNTTSEGHVCVRHCNLGDTCPEYKVCREDDSLLGYSCKKGCGYTDNCTENSVCLDDDSLLGFRCLRGCGYTSNCPDNTVCVDDDTPDGYSCRTGCTYTDDCPRHKVCVDDDTQTGFTCQNPCTIPGTCAADEACYEEPHSLKGYICVSTKPGRAVILGGWGDDGTLKSVEHVNFRPFPELPLSINDAAAATALDYIYLCGGYQNQSPSKQCYRLKISFPGSVWETAPTAPVVMHGHSAVSIGGSLIWFIHGNVLVEFDAEAETFEVVNLFFETNPRHCSVSNGTHAYIIGAGLWKDEIWVNERSMDGSTWLLVGNMKLNRYDHACLWYGSNIMITGGDPQFNDVEIFNTETAEIWTSENLLTGRRNHRMMLLDGLPTVLGGFGETGLETLESFSLELNKWVKLEKRISEARSHFSLVEF